MPKIRKKTSKRVNLRTRYSVLHKVSAHHKKLRKQAGRMIKAGIIVNKAKPKDSAIPNAFPGKEALINEMEQQHNEEKDERMSLIKANREARKAKEFHFEQEIRADVNMREETEEDKYGGLTKEELIEAERLIDPESAVQAANISKKSLWTTVKKAV